MVRRVSDQYLKAQTVSSLFCKLLFVIVHNELVFRRLIRHPSLHFFDGDLHGRFGFYQLNGHFCVLLGNPSYCLVRSGAVVRVWAGSVTIQNVYRPEISSTIAAYIYRKTLIVLILNIIAEVVVAIVLAEFAECLPSMRRLHPGLTFVLS